MKKKLISVLLALSMMFSLVIPAFADDAPTEAVAKIGGINFYSLADAVNPTATLNGDGKWQVNGSGEYENEAAAKSAAEALVKQRTDKFYVNGAETVIYYNTEAAAQETLVESNHGNDKWYLSTDIEHTGNSGAGWESGDAAKEAQVTGSESSWTFDGATEGPWSTVDAAKEAAKTQLIAEQFVEKWKVQNGDYTYDSKENAIAAIPSGTVLEDNNFYLTADFTGTAYANEEAAKAAADALVSKNGDGKYHFGADTTAFDTEQAANDAVSGSPIVLQANCASVDFSDKELTLDLNGYKLTGESSNAANVTVVNNGTAQTTLEAIGTYKNDVKAFVPDGFDAVGETDLKNKVVNSEDNNIFKVVLVVRDPSNGDRDESTGDVIDVFADDTVTVDVKVTGSRYVSADLTLTWDNDLFKDATNKKLIKAGWVAGKTGTETTSWRLTKSHDNDGYWEDGEVIGTFTFKAQYIPEDTIKAGNGLCTFTVKTGEENENAKIIGSWKKAKADSTTPALQTAQLLDDKANILLMDTLVGSVDAKEGLGYLNTPQNLLEDGYSANVGGVELDTSTSTIKYGVMSKADYDTAIASSTDAELCGTYCTSTTIPKGTNAGDYVVLFKISAPGYVSSTGHREVNIKKQSVALTWNAPLYNDGVTEGKTFAAATSPIDFEGKFDTVGFNKPTAKYTMIGNQTGTLSADDVTLTAYPNTETLRDVGVYTFKANENQNYEFTNPTCQVKVKGENITGWQLTATNATDDPENGVIWRDGTPYAIGMLVVDEETNLDPDEEDNPKNINVVYEYFEGTYYKEGDDIPAGKEIGDEIWTVTSDPTVGPTYSELGVRKLRMTVTADNYEKLEQEVTFTIKNPIFKVETTEYVAGYSLVLVYTNEDNVAFKYGTEMMYNVNAFGYKHNNVDTYGHVFGLVVKGVADESKVYASNAEAKTITLPGGFNLDNANPNKFDVNNKTAAQVDLDDITAVQSIYNVNAINMQDMELVLRCDVNRDKKVDTIGDVSTVLAYYLAH